MKLVNTTKLRSWQQGLLNGKFRAVFREMTPKALVAHCRSIERDKLAESDNVAAAKDLRITLRDLISSNKLMPAHVLEELCGETRAAITQLQAGCENLISQIDALEIKLFGFDEVKALIEDKMVDLEQYLEVFQSQFEEIIASPRLTQLTDWQIRLSSGDYGSLFRSLPPGALVKHCRFIERMPESAPVTAEVREAARNLRVSLRDLIGASQLMPAHELEDIYNEDTAAVGKLKTKLEDIQAHASLKLLSHKLGNKCYYLLHRVYAANPADIFEGTEVFSKFIGTLEEAGIDDVEAAAAVILELFQLVIPFLIYANIPRTGVFSEDNTTFSDYDGWPTLKIRLDRDTDVKFMITPDSPAWFAPAMTDLAEKVIALHENGIELSRYIDFYSKVMSEIFRVDGLSSQAVLRAMEHVEKALLAGKKDPYIRNVFRFERARQYMLENPDEWPQDKYEAEVVKLAKQWKVDLKILDIDFEERDPVEDIISSAREAEKDGRVVDALGDINEAIATRRDEAEVVRLLDEAQRIIEEADDPELFQLVLKIAAHNFNIGREDAAEALFSRVMKPINAEEDSRKRDNIRFAIAMRYKDFAEKDIRQMKKAEQAAQGIEGLPARFAAFREISRAYFANDSFGELRVGLAVNCLMANCFEIAKSCDSNDQLMKVLELLADWTDENEEEAKRVRQEIETRKSKDPPP